MPTLRDSLDNLMDELRTRIAAGQTNSSADGLAGPRLLVGLGNPGPEYAATRHNAGFLAIQALAGELGGSYWKVIGGAEACECRYLGSQVVLARPQRFMNLSGPPVKTLLKHYGLELDDLLVIHDELDLPQGVLRLKSGGGHAGHKGIRSISEAVGEGYARLRIGIGRPPGRMPADRFVLQQLTGESLEELKATAGQAASIALACLETGVRAAMNRYNGEA